MLKSAWIEDLSEAAKSVWPALRSLWAQSVWPVLMTLWIFLVLAAPLIIVIMILWYLDSIGWRSGSGFYTIGSAGGAHALILLG